MMSPSHRYNPKKKAGHGNQWEYPAKVLSLGDKRDLFYRDSNGWTYMGAFECKRITTISARQLKKMPRTVRICNRSS